MCVALSHWIVSLQSETVSSTIGYCIDYSASMKIRIKGNTIRIRLVQSEVATLKEQGNVTENVPFPGGRMLIYTLQVGEHWNADLDNHRITLQLPSDESYQWIDSDELSLSKDLKFENKSLKLLVEKDLNCLHPRPGEDESDAFPNPKQA